MIYNLESIQIRSGRWSLCPGSSEQPQCEDPSSVPPPPRPASARLMLGLLLYAFRTYCFPHPICVFYTCRNVIGSVIYFRVVKPQTVIHSTRNFNSYNQATEGFLLPLQLHPIFPKLRFYGEPFYASYNKPALNINAHFQCIWHFQTAEEKTRKMLQEANCKRNTFVALLLIRSKNTSSTSLQANQLLLKLRFKKNTKTNIKSGCLL